MVQPTSLTTITQAEYEAIESAVMETARGRWFLSEFTRRNRTADTQVLLEAIERLEQAVTAERNAQDLDRFRFDLMEMAKTISLTKSEIAAIRPADHAHSHLLAASESLDAIARTTERATSDILEAAEHIQEAAWTLREAGAEAAVCDDLDRRATDIYTACSFQDLTAQRVAKIVQTLRYLEDRINAMIELWGGASPAPDSGFEPVRAPDLPLTEETPTDLSQNDVDHVIVSDDLFAGPGLKNEKLFALGPAPLGAIAGPADDLAFIETCPPAPVPAPSPQQQPSHRNQDMTPGEPPPLRPEAFAEIDALDPREKLRRFT